MYRTVFIIDSIPQYKELLVYFKDRPFLTHIPSILNTFAVDYVTEDELKVFKDKGYEYLTWEYSEIDVDAHLVPEPFKKRDMGYPLERQTGSNFFGWEKRKEIKDNLWMLKAILAKDDIKRIMGDRSLEEATDFELEQILLFSPITFHIPKDYEFDNSWGGAGREVVWPEYILNEASGVWKNYLEASREISILTAVNRLRLKDLEESVEKCICNPVPDPPIPEISVNTPNNSVGEMKTPVRTELTVIPADREWDRVLGFSVYEIPTFSFSSNKKYVSNGNIYTLTYWGNVSSFINKRAMEVIEVSR